MEEATCSSSCALPSEQETDVDVPEVPVKRRKPHDGRDIIPEGRLPTCVRGESVNLCDKQTNIAGDNTTIQTQMVFNMGNQGEQPENTHQFDLEVCKQELITFYKHEMSRVQLLPWCDETRDMDDIYVSLELEQNTRGGTSMLANNEDLVTLQTSQNMPATRVLTKGVAGSGKSTLLNKLAYSWAQQESDSPLSKFKLVFILSLREVQRGCSLIDAIYQQILETTTKVPKDGLKFFIESHPNDVLLLLDGFDEYSGNDISVPKGIVEEIIAFKALRECHTILSTRPHKHLGLHISSYVSVRLLGFSSENIEIYMSKFFHGDAKKVGLCKRLKESEMLTSLSNIPVILMLLCLLWEDEQKLPNTQSELYQEFTLYLWRKYCVRYRKLGHCDEELDTQLMLEFYETISRMGKVALEGLFPKSRVTEEKLTFSEKDFGNLLFQLGCQTGLLTRERLRSKLNSFSAVTFLHKSFQEFCAAKFWASTDSDLFNCILKQIRSWYVLMRKIEVIKFCCGLAGRAEVISIIQHAISMYRLDEFHRRNINIDKILPILNLLYESQITSDYNLTMSLKSLMFNNIVDDLSVENYYPQILPIWHYFVKSAFGVATLATIKSVKFENHPYDSLDVITDTLACMPDVQSVNILFKPGDKSVANEHSINHLGVKIAALTKLTHMCVTGSLNISVVLHHISVSSSCKPTHIALDNVVFNKNDMVKFLSNCNNHLESLELDGCTILPCCSTTLNHSGLMYNTLKNSPTMGTLLCSIKVSNIKSLTLRHIHVGKAIGHIVRSKFPHLQALELMDAELKEDDIKILYELNTGEPFDIIYQLKKLDLSYNRVGIAGQLLAKKLQNCCQLERLELRNTYITNACVIELAKGFHKGPANLKSLNVSGNDFLSSGLDAVFEYIHHLTKLESLKISASVDNHCSLLVKRCLAAIGKAIPDEGEIVRINLNRDQIVLITNVAKKYAIDNALWARFSMPVLCYNC